MRLHPAGGALVVNLTITSQYEAFQCIFKNQTLLYGYSLTGAAVLYQYILYQYFNQYKSLPHTPPRLLSYSISAYTQDMIFTCSGSYSKYHPWRLYRVVCHNNIEFGVRTHTVERKTRHELIIYFIVTYVLRPQRQI